MVIPPQRCHYCGIPPRHLMLWTLSSEESGAQSSLPCWGLIPHSYLRSRRFMLWSARLFVCWWTGQKTLLPGHPCVLYWESFHHTQRLSLTSQQPLFGRILSVSVSSTQNQDGWRCILQPSRS